MFRTLAALSLSLLIAASTEADTGADTGAMPGADTGAMPQAYFIRPGDGGVVDAKFEVLFGLANWGIAPAGVEAENTGHMHLIIDAPPPKMGEPIPADHNYRHYGRGQTQTMLELPSGRHTLQLVVGDGSHYPISGLYSKVITVTVR